MQELEYDLQSEYKGVTALFTALINFYLDSYTDVIYKFIRSEY